MRLLFLVEQRQKLSWWTMQSSIAVTKAQKVTTKTTVAKNLHGISLNAYIVQSGIISPNIASSAFLQHIKSHMTQPIVVWRNQKGVVRLRQTNSGANVSQL